MFQLMACNNIILSYYTLLRSTRKYTLLWFTVLLALPHIFDWVKDVFNYVLQCWDLMSFSFNNVDKFTQLQLKVNRKFCVLNSSVVIQL